MKCKTRIHLSGYPKDEAAAVSSSAIVEFLDSDRSLQEVRLVFLSHHEARIYLAHHEFGSES
jgi:hypothetical protein